jgi:hypothetical protein
MNYNEYLNLRAKHWRTKCKSNHDECNVCLLIYYIDSKIRELEMANQKIESLSQIISTVYLEHTLRNFGDQLVEFGG